MRALVVLRRTLCAVSAGGTLPARELRGQNLPWRPAGGCGGTTSALVAL
ncbi:hypothetical protein [Microbispora sp. KK1-11]|nr:hypothetical protein [Microbispora sp. KK1-11]